MIESEKSTLKMEEGKLEEKESVMPKTDKEKAKDIAVLVAKFFALLLFLYFFIVSLDLMSNGFRVVGGKEAAQVLSSKYVLENKITGLMIGVLATVIVQSSSTSTSIVVSMVGSESKRKYSCLVQTFGYFANRLQILNGDLCIDNIN